MGSLSNSRSQTGRLISDGQTNLKPKIFLPPPPLAITHDGLKKTSTAPSCNQPLRIRNVRGFFKHIRRRVCHDPDGVCILGAPSSHGRAYRSHVVFLAMLTMLSRSPSSSSLSDTRLKKSAAYEPELKDLEVKNSLPRPICRTVPHAAGGPRGDHRSSTIALTDHQSSLQEKLLEGLSNCRALESVIRESFTSIKVRSRLPCHSPLCTERLQSPPNH